VIPAFLEALGLLASLLTLSIATRSFAKTSRVRRAALLSLVGLLGLGHLANVLETQGVAWADTFADQFSIMVPFLWGLFLLETGRGYLSARLAASDEQVRFFLEAVPSSVAWLDAEAKLLGFSQAWALQLPSSTAGRHVKDVLPVPLPKLLAAIGDHAAAPLLSHDLTSEATTSSDGRERHFRWCVRSWVHPDRKAPGALVLLEEVTAEVEAEERRLAAADELARTQRLAHVGEIAAGAAHDFNNFLQVINGALWELGSDPRYAQVVESVQQAVGSAREMTRSMLQFGRDNGSKPEVFDLAKLLKDLQAPLASALGRRHRVELTLPDSGPVLLEGRRLRLQQAVLNLALNARDAMPGGGAIEISLAVEGDAAWLSVHDAGTGMDEAVRSRLFTPFFTTKGQHGSGLGLHVVQSVVEEQCGEISVESAPASGSTFRLHLPLAKRSG
jgi:two-component system, cell cycle sensor histidine kinase and response regulator CckA